MSTTTTPKTKGDAASDDLSHQIEVLRTDLAKLASTITDDMAGGIEKAGHQISKTGRDAHASATNKVIEHPLASVGIAAVVGLLLGMMMRKG